LPLFSYNVIRTDNLGANEFSNNNYLIREKTIFFKFINFVFYKIHLQNNEELTVEHFYFNRSLNDVEFFLKAIKNKNFINRDHILLDPGCGSGKHIMFISDKTNCKGFGIDIYKPAINVAKKIEKFSKINFFCENSLIFLKSQNFSKIDIVFSNSILVHVLTNKDFKNFLDFLKKNKSKLMLIENKKLNIKMLKPEKILFHEYRGRAQYAVLQF
jgi:2-polyprenyl-3-methyl-5-hydroxy-6-metoxy-1,4-benzoquinol methylase